MEFPIQLLLLGLPAAIYFGRQRNALGNRETLSRLGIVSAPLRYYALGALTGFGAVGIGYWLLQQIGLDPATLENTNFVAYTTWTLSVGSVLLAALRETIFTTLGEELLFRGLLAGWLFRRFPFLKANVLQSIAFLLPHLILLAVSLKLWPLMLLIGAVGWVLGYLRYKSGSIFPGLLAHTIANTLAAVWVMQG